MSDRPEYIRDEEVVVDPLSHYHRDAEMVAVTGYDPHPITRTLSLTFFPGIRPLTLTKPLGLGVLNNRHKATGTTFPEAVAVMTALNRDASRAALTAGATCATDVTGFGLLGHLLKLCRASGVDAEIDAVAVPYVGGARAAVTDGFVPGGSRRNLDWVRPHLDATVDDDDLVLLADAQTSDPPPLIVVVGPTASGKTELAVRLAEERGGEIVSADSVQVYRHFDIGTGNNGFSSSRY